jgi:asparagine synthase (glutamine-hydrolysing)
MTMCGLLFSTRQDISETEFTAALRLMHHRGPDSQNVTCRDGIMVGHNRLSIVDLDPRSNQPFRSQCGNYEIIYNGMIYNYKELAEKHNLTLRTTSDTELLLELYLKNGARFLDELIGMFAFIIISLIDGKIFVARDRLGVKPLYVSRSLTGSIYSSEISPILKLLNSTQFNTHAIEEYRNLRLFSQGKTLYKDIEMFPAGCYESSGSITRYWKLEQKFELPPNDEELEHLIKSAVDYRLVSDVPVGSYLSGGVDSSLITAISAVQNSWSVGTKFSNEFEQAQETAEILKISNHNLEISESDFLDISRQLLNSKKEPICVPNEVLLTYLNREVKKVNTVMLSGEGADELFCGYSRVFSWASTSLSFKLEEFASLYSYTSSPNLEVIENAIKPYALESPYLTVSNFFQIEHLHGLLRRVDSASMQASIEARAPFVDHRLIERMFGVPFSWKSHQGISKAPLRRIATKYLPDRVAYRNKVGFPVDVNKIFSHEGLEVCHNPYDTWFNFNMNHLGIQEFTTDLGN